ncbi:glycosyltransferase family 2 protein [Clostridium thailandense]|uniref:Glycosyltransferase family 2 protein n=1 Tax=Clostridium thailandense TaxID=2794346 RepID=A0A949TSK6_9CLOT|nr:glycosyltransferase family 2 protein [Clostridium thailandense]MBV7275747.1 glycosyltransferase family 2 protein [Clostridium thailandense]MCH5136792.1 glycosyltransferase family 2 protein [Clostridiaceae bacterium UIB06]
MIDLSVVIPSYNEEGNIEPLYNRLNNILPFITDKYEIIFVNDGSKDNTVDKIESLCNRDSQVKLIDFSRNFGHEMANTAGLNYASGSAVVIMDADLQDPPELIKDMYCKYLEGYDLVYAKRKKRQKETLIKKATSKLFYRFLRYFSNIEIPLDTGDYRLMSRNVVNEFNKLKEHNRFFRGLTHWIGFKVTYVEFDRPPRNTGETNYNLTKLMKLAIDAVISFSYKPLKVFNIIGLFMALFSFFSIIYWIIFKIATGKPVAGWTSLITIILFCSGVIMMQISIIGEYTARTYEEVKNRPLFVINKTIGINEGNDIKEKEAENVSEKI